MSGMVYWAELQSELGSTGLKVVVDIPFPGSPWTGTLNGKRFLMSIPSRSEKTGPREWMIVTLIGQENLEEIISHLSEFMEYKPFCRYNDSIIDKATTEKGLEKSITYEWSSTDASQRFSQLEADGNKYNLERLEGGFEPLKPPEMSKFYQEFTPETVQKWEKAMPENPDAEWNYNKIREILPFVKKVMPRIGQSQSLFGLSIISLASKCEAKEEQRIVRYGLEPLLKSGVLAEEDVEEIVQWFLETTPTWDTGGDWQFKKEFEIDGIKYGLITDSHRNHRDLNLQVIH